MEEVVRGVQYYSLVDRGVWKRRAGKVVRCSDNGGIVAVALPSEDYRTCGCWRDPLLAKTVGMVS